MLNKTNAVKLLFGFLALALFAFSRSSYADWSVSVGVGGPGYWHDRDHFDGWHDHPHYGWHYHHLPPGCFTVWVGGVRYYYYDGLYYNYVGDGDYELVNPPAGAYVSTIPQDFQPVVINGATYYSSNGVYYAYTPQGYEVVTPSAAYVPTAPEVISQPAQVVESVPAVVSSAPVGEDTFPINVPNNSGGYTAVVIKRSGSGYVGPQGEYHATFPSVAQLKAMYVK